MGKDKEGERVLVTGNENPITELVTKCREYTNFLDKWTSKQSFPVKAAVVTTTAGISYAGIGFVFRPFLDKIFYRNPYTKACCSLRRPLLEARNFGLCGVAQSSIYCVMERLRGKKDTATCMLAGFSSGVIYAMAWGTRGPRVIFPGAIFTLIHVGMFKCEESNTGTYVEEEEKVSQSYYRTRHMLSSLGLEDYENNFKKGVLADKTLPLLTNRDLQEVEIPVGARLLILDYIDQKGGRDEEIKDLEAAEE